MPFRGHRGTASTSTASRSIASPAAGATAAAIGSRVSSNPTIATGGSFPSPASHRTCSSRYIPYSWVYDDASNVDLRQFKAAGGKLIHYQGWADEVVNPASAVDYYETVERVMGGRAGTQDFYRLFMVPGQSYIPGNIGAESVNYLYALEDWVERGKAPDALVGRKLKSITMMLGPITMDEDMKPANYLYSRPLYPYPLQARYRGKGDPDDAASFGPWDPATGKFVG